MIRPADIGFFLVEVGAWFAIGKAILRRERWGTSDAYWLWVGSPGSAIMSFVDGLWLYGGIWCVWMGLMFVKRLRRESSVTVG